MYLTYYAHLGGMNGVIDYENARSGKLQDVCSVFGHEETLPSTCVSYALR